MLTAIVDWVVRLMELLGAPGVGLAILLENLFPPIPSEVVLPLAGFTASQGDLNVWAALVWATIGSVAGAFLLYGLGAGIGAPRLRQIADWMWLVEPEDVDKALAWFDRYGKWSVFFGRLIPGIRSLISIPAGVDRMSPVSFGLMTLAGSALWNSVLIYAGVVLGDNYHLVEKYVGEYSTVVYVIVGIGLLVVFGLLARRARRRNQRRKADMRGTTR
ncbi:DedA family protein [Corynebacterium nasicanis]|uniref:DedA family protein n=1 Tax=Corynebacterium nasicanis TaxID=1448267 RepID=A0ABW1QC82_9CORY